MISYHSIIEPRWFRLFWTFLLKLLIDRSFATEWFQTKNAGSFFRNRSLNAWKLHAADMAIEQKLQYQYFGGFRTTLFFRRRHRTLIHVLIYKSKRLNRCFCFVVVLNRCPEPQLSKTSLDFDAGWIPRSHSSPCLMCNKSYATPRGWESNQDQ